MKAIDNILGFVFITFLSFVLLFTMGPYFIKLAGQPEELKQLEDIKSIKFNYAFNVERYLMLTLVTKNDKTLAKRFFVTDNEHTKLIDFFVKNKVVTSTSLKDILPVNLNNHRLETFTNIQVKTKNTEIKKLVINGTYVVGNSTTLLRRAFLYFLGVFAFIVGALMFLLLVFVIITYRKTGELPNTPDKIEGLKYIFRGFKSKK